MPKGQAKIYKALFAVIAVAIFLFVVTAFVQRNLYDLARQLATESAEVVAKDLAGFLTISSAATEDIEITYSPSSTFSYDVDIENRIVGARSLLRGDYLEGPKIFGWEIEPFPWQEKTILD